MLGHNLNLSCYENIKDVSMLGNVHTLDLYGCQNIPQKQINDLKNS
mgnify:CR=1 FL=1